MSQGATLEAIMRWTIRMVVLLAACLLCVPIHASEWAQFRGPGGTAVSSERGLPAQWGADKNIAWKVKLPGYGWSCPVVWGDKIFVTTAVADKQQKPTGGFGFGGAGGLGRGAPGGRPNFGGFMQPGLVLSPFLQNRLNLTDQQKKQLEALQKQVDGKLDRLLSEEQKKQIADMRQNIGRRSRGPDVVYRWEVYCLSAADGKVIWKHAAAEGKPSLSIHPSNTYATETPVTDGERVYAYFGMTGVFCYDFSGKLLWKADLGSYPMAMGNGTGSSPVLDGGWLFIQCDNEEKSFLVALDAKTGKELWRTPRSEHTGWSTPFVWKNKKRTEIVCLGSPTARSYDPQTGKQLWQLKGLTGQCKATPVANEEMLFIGTGGGPAGFGRGGDGGEGGVFSRGKPLFAIKAGASGDISLKAGEDSNEGVAWHQPQGGPATPSPVLYEGHLYVLEDRGGLLSCFDAHTGEKVYKERIPGARGFTSSPWAYDGKLFFLDDAGATHVVKAGSEFQVLGKNALDEMCWSSPAIANGSLYLRTVDHLFCIRNHEKGK
jgi:outer membrane protein assembly factor BamB